MSKLDQKAAVSMLLSRANQSGIFSGAQALWGNLNTCDTLWQHAELGSHSWAQSAGDVTVDSFFDLASMTKALVTAPLIFERIENDHFELNSTLGEFFPNLDPALKHVQVGALLNHTSGLLWWHPFYETLQGHDSVLNALKQFPPIPEQVGKVVYSDLGFLWLTRILESRSGQWIDQIAREKLFQPLRLDQDLFYRRLDHPAMLRADPKFVATEICPRRGWLQGQVHDDNTFAMNGVSGHSGLFGSALSVGRLVKSLVEGRILKQHTLKKMWTRSTGSDVTPRTYGWDCPSPDGSGTTGALFNHSAVGHLGFTGTSIWMELDTGRFGVLLTNRVHPSRKDLQGIRRLRRAFHDTIFSS